jgi:hypothetical protein
MKMNAMKLAIPMFVAALAYGPSQGWAIILGADLASFAVLGATEVTNVPTSTIGGNLGVAPGTSTGGGYVFTSGSLQSNTAIAQQAQLDLDQAILDINAQGPGLTIGTDLTGTRGPGTYTVPAAATNLTGTLVLDGGGSNTAVWNFLFPSTFIMSEGSDVTVVNVGDGSGVGIYWSVGSAATLNGDTLFGNVFANTLISSNGGLTLGCGRLASATAAVTLIQDTISLGCAGFEDSGGFGEGVDTGSGGQVVPEPGTLLLFGFGLAGLFASRKKLFPVA